MERNNTYLSRREVLCIGACITGGTVSGCLDDEHEYGPTPEEDPPVDVSDMDLEFWDTFERDELDEDRWYDKYPWYARTHNYNGYADPENSYIEDDILVLEAEEKPQNDKDYTTGVVSSNRHFSPGYFEGRIKIPPTVTGFWPAFWLTPYDEWPPEIDIFEFFGDDPCCHMTYHYRDDDGELVEVNEEVCETDYSEDFHVYGVDWSSEEIVWYIDGEEQFTYDDEEFVTEEEMALIFNFGIEDLVDGFVGEPRSEDLPATLEMDWVRVWQR